MLVFDLGSTTPFLSKKFQDLRFFITDCVVNGAPVWAGVGGKWFMYRSIVGGMMISKATDFAQGNSVGYMCNMKRAAGGVAPTDLLSGEWMSNNLSTLSPQYASAERVWPGLPWVHVPAMRITVVHGLHDDDPTMAAVLQQLASHC